MNILHYSLGLPPYRSGGLTKYCHDLMIEQVKYGEKVYLLFPGQMKILNKKQKISFYKYYKDIQVYELVNPLPVPLLKGIARPSEFMKSTDIQIFIQFLLENNIEIIHIHTIMGLPKEFFQAAKNLNIKLVYTSHDYFGICAKVNFIDSKGQLCETRDLNKCIKCNANGISKNKMRILQSKSYRYAKNIGIIGKIKNILSSVSINKDKIICSENRKSYLNLNEFKELLSYYENLYKYIDEFLFNSSVSQSIFRQYLNVEGKVIPLTHKDIKDKRIIKKYQKNKLNLTYLGPTKAYKGFFLLRDTMLKLEESRINNIVLSVYGDISINSCRLSSNINLKNSYSYKDLEKIFYETDLLIVPSIWYETYGFITIEALSYGVPVLTTNRVGSKDLLISEQGEKGIITDASTDRLFIELKKLIKNRSRLEEFNKNILKDKFNYSIEKHYENINKIYKNL